MPFDLPSVESVTLIVIEVFMNVRILFFRLLQLALFLLLEDELLLRNIVQI